MKEIFSLSQQLLTLKQLKELSILLSKQSIFIVNLSSIVETVQSTKQLVLTNTNVLNKGG